MLTRNRNRQGSSIVSDETELPPGKCRICLKEGEIPIFGEYDIADDVMEFGGIEVSDDDNLPQHLCDACHSLLDAAILFRNTARKSDEILKNSFDTENASMLSEDLEQIYETDNDFSIKKEYLEFKDTSSESETEWKHEPKQESKNLRDMIQFEPDTVATNNDKEIEMQMVKVSEDKSCGDLDTEVVMIIVSDKNKNSDEHKASEIPLSRAKSNTSSENNDTDLSNKDDHTAIPDHQRKCDVCHELVDKNSFRLHIKQHRNKYKEQYSKRYSKVECEICGKQVSKYYHKYHIQKHGTDNKGKLVECGICNKSFNAQYFSDHMRRMHDKKQKADQTEKPEKKMIKCPVCDKKFNESVFKAHLAKHGGKTRRYICDQCGKEFKHPSAFKTHTLTHGSELKYQCQFCPYRGLHLALLKVHVRTHTGDYNYKCTECPARFITKSNLSKHLLRHQGVCKFKCDICERGFYSKRDVDKHIKTVHLELKNNICDLCGKGFGHRDNLLSHQLKVHKREKITDKRGRMPSYLKEQLKLKQ